MNDELVQLLVNELVRQQSRQLNVLEWKIENSTLTIKTEDEEDGMIDIYVLNLRFLGTASSLEKGNFFHLN